MGGSGWEPGFLFGQAAKISHNVAFLCQLGLVALHKGGRLVLEGPGKRQQLRDWATCWRWPVQTLSQGF